LSSGILLEAAPHKDRAEISQAYWRMSRNFCARCRKRRKQIRCKAVRRALCGAA